MNIERLTDSKYIVFMNNLEACQLKMLAKAFHKGNKSVTLKEIIEEGTQLSLCVKDMLNDYELQDEHAKRFCETQKSRVDRLWKEQTDGSKRPDEG